jgi:hypothetical protein
MPVVNGPDRDPEGDDPPRRHKAPKALARLKRQFTEPMRLEAFRETFGRDPNSDEELDEFADEYIRELYNSGFDEP